MIYLRKVGETQTGDDEPQVPASGIRANESGTLSAMQLWSPTTC